MRFELPVQRARGHRRGIEAELAEAEIAGLDAEVAVELVAAEELVGAALLVARESAGGQAFGLQPRGDAGLVDLGARRAA